MLSRLYQIESSRRRLVRKGDKKYSFQPISWDYGYEKPQEMAVNGVMLATSSLGAFSTSGWESSILLGITLGISELLGYLLGPSTDAGGVGVLHSSLAGFCWYHYFINGSKSMPLQIASWTEIAGHGVLKMGMSETNPSQLGAIIGMLYAYLIQMYRGKHTPWSLVPVLSIIGLSALDIYHS